jgi:hypothetical protein
MGVRINQHFLPVAKVFQPRKSWTKERWQQFSILSRHAEIKVEILLKLLRMGEMLG